MLADDLKKVYMFKDVYEFFAEGISAYFYDEDDEDRKEFPENIKTLKNKCNELYDFFKYELFYYG